MERKIIAFFVTVFMIAFIISLIGYYNHVINQNQAVSCVAVSLVALIKLTTELKENRENNEEDEFYF